MADDLTGRLGYSRSAFESELLSLSEWLNAFARRLTNSAAAAEDLVQTTFMLALSKEHLYDPSQKLRSWLGTMMHNAYVSIMRKESRSCALDDDAFFDRCLNIEESPEARIDLVNGFLRAAPRVLLLPERQRDAIIGQHYLGLSHYDMQKIFSCPLGTVKGFIREGIRKVRAGMENPGEIACDLAAIEQGVRGVGRDHPYFPIAEAVRTICLTMREYRR